MPKTATLNGQQITYSDTTQFQVQVGRWSSRYRTRYTVIGNLGQAVLLFNGINIGFGYKKRLYAKGLEQPVLATQQG